MSGNQRSGSGGWQKWFVSAAVVLGALLLAFGGLTIVTPTSSIAGAYLTDRNFPLAALLILLLIVGWPRMLGIVVATTAVIHALDAIFDVAYQNSAGVVGSIVFALIFAFAATLLLRQRGSLWGTSGWRASWRD